MNKTLLSSMHHIKNNIVELTRTVNGTTKEGQETLTALAIIHDQLNALTDQLKAK